MIGAFLTETCAFGWRGAGVWKHSSKPSWFPTIRVGNYLGCISRGVDWVLWEICRIFSHSNCYLSLHTSIEFWSAKKNNWMVNFDLRSFAKSFAFPMRRKRIGDQSVTLHCGIRRTEKVTNRSGLTKSFLSPNKKKSINIKRKVCRQQLPNFNLSLKSTLGNAVVNSDNFFCSNGVFVLFKTTWSTVR